MKTIKTIEYDDSNIMQTVETNEPKNSIGRFRREGEDTMTDINTGEKVRRNKSPNKRKAIKSVRHSMRYAYDVLKNNFLKYDKVYSIDATFAENPKSYEEYMRKLNNFTKRLRHRDENVKYMIFKEIGSRGRYHAHIIIADMEMTKPLFQSLWGYGQKMAFNIMETEEDILYKGMYLTNYSGDSDISLEKLDNLTGFPIDKHLYISSKNLKKPEYTKGEPDLTDCETIFETPDSKANRLNFKMTTYKKVV